MKAYDILQVSQWFDIAGASMVTINLLTETFKVYELDCI